MKIDKRIFKKFDSILKNYSNSKSEDNLNELLELYQMMNPNWVRNFNQFSRGISEKNSTKNDIFDDFLRVELPIGYTVESLKAPENRGNNSFTDIMQRGRIIHLSNKIAHQFDYMIETQIREYLQRNKIKIHSKEDLKDIKSLIKSIYSPHINEKKKARYKDLLKYYGLDEVDFEEGRNLSALNLTELINGYNNAMLIKDTEIRNVDTLVYDYDRRDVSYGIREDEDSNQLFVMDIQKFGQFAVHIVNPELASQIRTQYKMPLYKKETYMLVDHMSKKAKEFIRDAQNDDSMDEERRIPKYVGSSRKKRERLEREIGYLPLTPGEKHQIAVKGGLIRRNLEDLTDEEEWRR